MASFFARRAFAAFPKPAAVQVPFKAAPRAVFSAVFRGRFYSSDVPSDLKYTKEHEWVRKNNGNKYALGITAKAGRDLGDIVYVELPEVGASFSAGDEVGSIESVKAVAEIFSPVAGTVTAVNEALADAPETLNEDPYGEGWLVEIEVEEEKDVEGLLSGEAYEAFVKESDE